MFLFKKHCRRCNLAVISIIIKRTTANITNCRSTRLIRLSRTISSCSRRAIIILPRAARRASFASLRKAIIRIKQRESFLGTNTQARSGRGARVRTVNTERTTTVCPQRMTNFYVVRENIGEYIAPIVWPGSFDGDTPVTTPTDININKETLQ